VTIDHTSGLWYPFDSFWKKSDWVVFTLATYQSHWSCHT